ncbi:MAG TPA: hypothetical protein VHB18_03315 [Mycobacteriales bacterium]|nr:hypothetical protein [Mycobacteriales bacterium]
MSETIDPRRGAPSGFQPRAWGNRLVSSADARVAVALAATFVLLMRADRFWSFFIDEWDTIAYRRHGGAAAFLAPHNGHLQAVVIAIYRVLFATVGLRSYRPYEAVNVALQIVLGVLLYRFARKRVGPLIALPAALVVVLNGDGWQVLLWAINIGFVVPMISLVCCLMVLDRGASRRREVAVAGLLILALASSGLGIATTVGVAVVVLLDAERRRWALSVAIPAALYLAWFTLLRPTLLPPASLRAIPGSGHQGDVGSFATHLHLGSLPRYFLRSAEAACNAVVGRQPGAGYLALIVVAAVLIASLLIRRRVSREFVAVGATLVTFWLMLDVARLNFAPPTGEAASRYVYPSTFLVVLLLVEAVAGIQRHVRAGLPLAVLIALSSCWVLHLDVKTIQRYRDGSVVATRDLSSRIRAGTCGPGAADGTVLDPMSAPTLTAGMYRAAVEDLGRPPGQSCTTR